MSGNTKTKLIVNDDLIGDIANGVQMTFSSMFGLSAKMGRPNQNVGANVHADISGIVNLIQEQEEGTFVVSFPSSTIFAMLGKIYGKSFNSIDPSVENGVGELTNIIYGTVKTKLNKEGLDLKMAIPHVILGHDHKIMNIGQVPTLVIPFATESGSFHILLTVYSNSIQLGKAS